MVFKCKMCGGNLNIDSLKSVVQREYCGTVQTLPILNDDKKVKLFERANRFRFDCEFDKADMIYESIISEFPDEAEAYWGRVLCKYGIEYVDDPVTGNKVPTSHRINYLDVKESTEYLKTIANAEEEKKALYIKEAETIEKIRKKSIEISSNSEPYDIFICYKEKNAQGDRTEDSTIAENIYEKLTNQGYKVFFSRISLEDKLGVEYEPYIFSALNSAKVMLVVSTSFNNFDALWVRNEWSRYLSLMKTKQDITLIPCYKRMDVSDIPKELSGLQALDLGQIGAEQDLVRGIKKLIPLGGTSKELSSQVVDEVKQEFKKRRNRTVIHDLVWGAIIVAILVAGMNWVVQFVEDNGFSTVYNQILNIFSGEPEEQWKISDIVINTSEEDVTTDMDIIPYGTSDIYIHYKIADGPDDEMLQTECIVSDPTGTTSTFQDVQVGYYTGVHTCWYDSNGMNLVAPRGTHTFKIYNVKTENLLGAKSVNVE